LPWPENGFYCPSLKNKPIQIEDRKSKNSIDHTRKKRGAQVMKLGKEAYTFGERSAI